MAFRLAARSVHRPYCRVCTKGSRSAAKKGGGDSTRNGGEAEITFVPELERGLKAGGARARAEETVWERRQRVRREKRLTAKAERKEGREGAKGQGTEEEEEAADGDVLVCPTLILSY